MALNKTLSFDLELKPGGIPPIIHASQGDIGRMFKANIYWDGAAATSYVSGATVNLRGKKPDKTVFDYTATLAGSMVTFETTEQMTIISGPVECELVFSNDGDVIASANFVLMVEESPYDPNALSESDIPAIGDLIEETIGGDVRDEVDALITAHPELMLQDNAVTTPKIASGAVTEGKIASNAVTTGKLATGAVTSAKVDTSFLKTIENAYVTPEQFGAVGDGVADDTRAFSQCLNAGKTIILTKTYKVTSLNIQMEGVKIVGKYLSYNEEPKVIVTDSIYLQGRYIDITDLTLIGTGNNTAFTINGHNTHKLNFENLLLRDFQKGFYLSESNVLWNCTFRNIKSECLTTIDFTNSNNSFALLFENVNFGGNNIFKKVKGTFICSNFGFSADNEQLTLDDCYCIFLSCNFECDINDIATQTAIDFKKGYFEFNACSFVLNVASSVTFFRTTSNVRKITFVNCYSYTGSDNAGTYWNTVGAESAGMGTFEFVSTSEQLIPSFSGDTYKKSVYVDRQIPRNYSPSASTPDDTLFFNNGSKLSYKKSGVLTDITGNAIDAGYNVFNNIGVEHGTVNATSGAVNISFAHRSNDYELILSPGKSNAPKIIRVADKGYSYATVNIINLDGTSNSETMDIYWLKLNNI